MRILVSGSSGLIGSTLVPELENGGHSLVRLVRHTPAANEIQWNPEKELQPTALERFDAVVHLAGENIAGRWTASKKSRIRDSRVQGTSVLTSALPGTAHPPSVMVCASAIGIYGNRGDEVLREESELGSDFLAQVCKQWEAATERALRAGVRVVLLRIGIVLSRNGGALARMLLPFRMGLGGRIGSGKQWMSWITLDDVVGIIQHALATESLRGAVNTVAPHPVINAEFTRTLGELLHRPTIFPLPELMVRTIFGEMGEALLLSSQRVDCGKLLASGYHFRHAELGDALKTLLSN